MRKPCLTRDCPNLAEHGDSRCAQHKRAQQRARDAIRGTPAQRGYGPEYQRNRKRVLADGYPCHWCGAFATTADHLVPLAKGGDSSLDNLVASCAGCNYSRGAALAARARRLR